MTAEQHEHLNHILKYDLLDVFMGLSRGIYSEAQAMEMVNQRVEAAFELGQVTPIRIASVKDNSAGG